MKESKDEYLKGFFVGSIQALFGHPFDTVKTNIQANKKVNIYNLYKGFSYPLLTNSFINSLIFGSYSNFYNKTNNHFLSGFLAGLIVGPIISPIEKLKIDRQIGNSFNKKIFRGVYITCLRESFGTAIYFSSYNYFKNIKLVEGDMNIMLAGGNAGLLSWLLTYPIDVVKTRIQLGQDKYILTAFKKGKLFNGLKICLIRSFLVNSIGFYVYEKFK